MSKSMLGWHWLRDDGCMRDGARALAGETYHVDPPVEPCVRGLHASGKALDSLRYAPGPIVCRVRLHGTVVRQGNKAAATDRTVLWVADATTTLNEFACWCAERALAGEREAGREPDARSWAAVAAKRSWLCGAITDGQLAAARAAARDAAGDAAGDAAWAAARDAQENELTRMLLALGGEPR